jgi:hypothetical protein
MMVKAIELASRAEKRSGRDSYKHSLGAIEVNSWASRATLDIIGTAGLGRGFDALSDQPSPLVANYHSIYNLQTVRFLFFCLPRLPSPITFRPVSPGCSATAVSLSMRPDSVSLVPQQWLSTIFVANLLTYVVSVVIVVLGSSTFR